jgi:hypothetical protein
MVYTPDSIGFFEQPNSCAYCPFEDQNDPFIKVLKEMVDIYNYKNKFYKNSYKIAADLMHKPVLDVLLARIVDKVVRICNLNDSGDDSDESIRDNLIDLANYSVMAVMSLYKNED